MFSTWCVYVCLACDGGVSTHLWNRAKLIIMVLKFSTLSPKLCLLCLPISYHNTLNSHRTIEEDFPGSPCKYPNFTSNYFVIRSMLVRNITLSSQVSLFLLMLWFFLVLIILFTLETIWSHTKTQTAIELVSLKYFAGLSPFDLRKNLCCRCSPCKQSGFPLIWGQCNVLSIKGHR